MLSDLLLPEPIEEMSPYRSALVRLGQARDNVVVLGADLANSNEIDAFARAFPGRFINVGAAEQNEVDIAAGLAFEGEIPFVHSFGVFLTRRAYEQVCIQVALHNANVKLVGLIPGLTSRLGPTHQAIDDLSLMRVLPNMTVLDMADATEIEQAVEAAAQWDGPVYMRMQRREVIRLLDPEKYRFSIGKALLLRQGGDVLLVTTGLMLQTTLAAAALLHKANIEAAVLHCPSIKPMDSNALLQHARGVLGVVTVENHLISGGLGGVVAEILGEHLPKPMARIGLRDQFACPGSPAYLFERYGLTPDAIVAAAKDVLSRTNQDMP